MPVESILLTSIMLSIHCTVWHTKKQELRPSPTSDWAGCLDTLGSNWGRLSTNWMPFP